MFSKFGPKNIMISDFWAKKIQNIPVPVSEFNGKKLFHFVFTVYCLMIKLASRWVLIFTDY